MLNQRYTLDPAPLGSGGMGEVWGGHDTVLGRRVAVKLIRTPGDVDDPELEHRFRREAEVMARLTHPGAPAVHDAGVSDGPPYGRRMFIVMEFVDGVRLDDVIAEVELLPIGWAAAIGAQVAAVLDAAHAKSVLHRDLKPANLILCSDGAVKVIDFGLALLHDPAVTRLTRTGQVLGTALYMPPEQIRSQVVTARSDLYALGCVLYEMLTGRPPFTGDGEYAILEQHVNTRPVPVEKLRPNVPLELADLVAELLAKDPAKRPQDAASVHSRLVPYVSGAPPLPRMADRESSPLRLYADVLIRVLHRPTGSGTGTTTAPRTSARPKRVALGQARREATALARDGHRAEAARVLTAALEPDGRPLGLDDPDVVKLRLLLANVLTEEDDRRAAAVFLQLGDGLAARYGDTNEQVVQCRLGEADCYERLGDGLLALHVLRDLLAGQLSVRPADEPGVLELRRRVGELEAVIGDRVAARRTLTDLHEDLIRGLGPQHPSAIRVRERLERLDS